MGVDVHGERHTQRDQEHLRRLADAEPDDHQRDEAEDGDRPQHLHRRVDEVVTPAGQAGEDREGQTRGDPEAEPDHHSLQRDQQVLLELAGGPELAPGLEHRAGRGQRVLVDHAGGAQELPDSEHDQRTRELAHDTRRRAAAALPTAVTLFRVHQRRWFRILEHGSGQSCLLERREVEHAGVGLDFGHDGFSTIAL